MKNGIFKVFMVAIVIVLFMVGCTISDANLKIGNATTDKAVVAE